MVAKKTNSVPLNVAELLQQVAGMSTNLDFVVDFLLIRGCRKYEGRHCREGSSWNARSESWCGKFERRFELRLKFREYGGFEWVREGKPSIGCTVYDHQCVNYKLIAYSLNNNPLSIDQLMTMNTCLSELRNKGDDIQRARIEASREAKKTESDEAKSNIASLSFEVIGSGGIIVSSHHLFIVRIGAHRPRPSSLQVWMLPCLHWRMTSIQVQHRKTVCRSSPNSPSVVGRFRSSSHYSLSSWVV